MFFDSGMSILSRGLSSRFLTIREIFGVEGTKSKLDNFQNVLPEEFMAAFDASPEIISEALLECCGSLLRQPITNKKSIYMRNTIFRLHGT